MDRPRVGGIPLLWFHRTSPIESSSSPQMRKLLGWSVKSPESGPGWLSWSVSQLLHIHIISLLAGEGRSWLSGSPMPHSWDQLSHAAAQVPRLIPLRFFYEFCFLLSSVALKVSVLSWKERNVDTSGQKKKGL